MPQKKYRDKTEIALIVIWCVLFIATGLFLAWSKIVYGSQHTELKTAVEADEFFAKWQSYIADDAALNDVVTVGSHDSGTLGMMPLAETQGHSFADQLKGGVRYFDIRVTEKNGELVIFHGPIKGQKFEKVLNEIKNFITSNPSEFLVLDFQHLGDKCHDKVMTMITEILGTDKAMKKSLCPTVEGTTMGDVRAQNINFVIVWKEASETKDRDYLYARTEYLSSPYDGKIHRSKNVDDLISHYAEYYDGYNGNGFFVLQAQRTAPNILFDRPADNEIAYKEKINNYVSTLSDDNLAKTNIIMRDFVVSDMTNVKTILSLNLKKGLVKTDKIAEFTLKTA